MCECKRSGNVLIGAMIFLFMSMIFITTMYKLGEIKRDKGVVINIGKSGIEIEESFNEVLINIQNYLNSIERVEVNKIYKQNNWEVVLLEKKQTKLKILNKEVIVKVEWEKIELCTCLKENCNLSEKKKIILKPLKGVEN